MVSPFMVNINKGEIGKRESDKKERKKKINKIGR